MQIEREDNRKCWDCDGLSLNHIANFSDSFFNLIYKNIDIITIRSLRIDSRSASTKAISLTKKEMTRIDLQGK